jgi:hypothetical protein
VIHQNAHDTPARRRDDAAAKGIRDALAVINERYRKQIPSTGSEVAVRRMIEELAAGRPDYSRMSAGLAARTRQQLPMLQMTFAELGPISDITFKEVSAGGADLYHVTWQHGAGLYAVDTAPDRTINRAIFQPED